MEFTTEQKIKLLEKMGYTVSPGSGPQTVDALIKSQGLENKFKTLGRAAGGLVKNYNAGGAVRGYNAGGTVSTYQSGDGTRYVARLPGGRAKTFVSESSANNWLQQNSTSAAPPPTSTPDPTQVTPTSQPTAPTSTLTQNTGTGQYYDNLNSLFNQYLGRDIRDSGASYYSNMLNSGQLTLDQVENEIRTSPEAQQYQANPTPQTSAQPTSPTQNTGVNNTGGFGDYEQGGYWVRRNGESFAFMGSDGKLTDPSDEEKAAYTVVSRAFMNGAGRLPKLEGLNYYVGQIMGGRSPQEVEAEIAGNLQGGSTGSEGGGGAGSNGEPQTGGEDVYTALASATEQDAFEMIRNTFRNSLGRNIEQGGLDYYIGQFREGRPLAEILNEIIRSEEAQQNNNNLWNGQQTLNNYQKAMMLEAYTNPDSNVFAQEVERILATEGTLIDPNTGQVTGDRGYDPSTIAQDDIAQATAPENTGTATYEATQVGNQLNQTLSDLEAQTATPSNEATVRGQLEILMDDFEDGTPPWASGAMRQAMGVMQTRGLGASSMAGQAIVQAAMEAAIPIASQDAQTFASFEMQNLDNRQQTEIFKAQQRIASLFTDQAADNAAKQFNASSENQTNQFFASLEESTARFNAAQVNAVNQINVDAENAAKQFNEQMGDLRDRFNATNSLVIAQANAQWRQNIATINTAAQNDANMEYAKQTNLLTAAALDQLWQRERDIMSFAFTSAESMADRELDLLLADRQEDLYKWKSEQESGSAVGQLFGYAARKVLDWGFG